MGTHSQTQSVLSNIIIVSNQMLVVLVNYWCPKGQMSIWQFLRRNWVPWWLSSKESACDARAAVDTDPMDCSPPDPSVHGTSQAGVPEGLAMSSSKDVPNTWIEHRSPALQAHSLPTEPPGKPLTTLPSIGEGNGNPLHFLPGESHGRRSLVGYSPRCRKESDMTERLHFHWVA